MRTRNNPSGSTRASSRISESLSSPRRQVDGKARIRRATRPNSIVKSIRKPKSRHGDEIRKILASANPDDSPADAPLPIITRSDAARDAVFNTPELFEQILSLLPLESFFTSQRVNKHFHHMISQCPRPFLTPPTSSNQPQVWKYIGEDPHDIFASWLEERYMRLLRPGEKAPDSNGYPTKYTPAHHCPLLMRQHWERMCPEYKANSIFRIHMKRGEFLKFNLEFPSHPLEPAASWHKMFISEPPTYSATVDLHWTFIREFPKTGLWAVATFNVKKIVTNPDGLTLGDLVRLPENGDALRWNSNGRVYNSLKDPRKSIANLEKKHKAKAYLDDERSLIMPDGVVFPSEEERRAVEEGMSGDR